MTKRIDPKLNRRDLLKASVAGSIAIAGANSDVLAAPAKRTAARVGAKPDLIQKENQLPGSNNWQLTRVRTHRNTIRSPQIEGYCSRQSVSAGEKLDIMVSTDPVSEFKIEIFRTGYYGGAGARLMATLGPFPGVKQPTPVPDEHGLAECNWEPSASITIPSDWPSGVYLGRLTALKDKSGVGYWQSYVIFIVKDDRPADILFQCSDNTWQAYNQWPEKHSLYTHPKGIQSSFPIVSFDRPYGRYPQIFINPQSVGSGSWLCFEFPLAYWLESQGYDVTYCSNSDMLTPDRALKCKAFLSTGHDEYWDIRQYESVVAIRDAGVNLMFLSGNACCWVTPFSESSRGVPNRKIFRGGPFGGEHKWAVNREKGYGPYPFRGPDEGYLIGARNSQPVTGGGDWTVVKADHWVFEGTGMKNGDSIPGLVGWEVHGDPPTDIKGLEVLARGFALHDGETRAPYAATIYPGPKDNFVFNAATIFWSQGMANPPGHMIPHSHYSRPHGADARVQRITQNVLDKAIGRKA
jgi:hypothetical protein